LRISTLRCTVGSSTNRDTAVSTASRRINISIGSGLAESTTSWAASMGSAARIARLRSKSSARLWAIRNSQARIGGSSSSSSRATRARAKVSCTTSSPSITEPIRRAQ
jgi:hypothetical protein